MRLKELFSRQPVIPAPMAGVTDFPFRQILRELGIKFVFTEMVSSKGLVYGNQKTEELLDFNSEDGFWTGVQIFGEDPEIMGQAAVYIEETYAPQLIDINMGCPVNKVVKNGAGAALMKDADRAEKIVEEVVKKINLPVTVKIRAGWNKGQYTAREISRRAEQAGAEAVTIHGRARSQFYEGQADWDIIQATAREVNIPVVGNGDIFTPQTAREKFRTAGCRALMVARGLQGNPWLVSRANQLIKTGSIPEKPDIKEIIDMACHHLDRAVNYYGPHRAVPKMRKHLHWYIKGLPYATIIKDQINQLKEVNQIKTVLKKYKTALIKYQQGCKEELDPEKNNLII